MIACVQWNMDSRGKDDHKGPRHELASNFFEGVYIQLNPSDHCLFILEHDHTTRNMPISFILVVLNALLLVSSISN